MKTIQHCSECGATIDEDKTCQDHFHQMLYWESENSDNWQVHHLTVLCYHLQHPSFYSSEGLQAAFHLLADFVVGGLTPQAARRRGRAPMNSHNRTWKITGTSAEHGSYDHPVHWTMTAAYVTANGTNNYRDSVRTWARSVYEQLKALFEHLQIEH